MGLLHFPAEFFRDEERDGFLVPEMMKRAWAAELEVLEVIRRVCKEHDLKFYACGGTLLGAIRHKGFIPWDDDIDIYMLRDEYDRFLEIAPQVLPEGFVLAGTYGSEPRLWEANNMPQARVIADENYFPVPKLMTYFHGFPYMRVGVDIFPYDYLPADEDRQYELLRLYYELNFTEANLDLYIKDGVLEKRLQELERYLPNRFEREDMTILRHELRLAADKWVSQTPKEEGVTLANAMFFDVPKDRRDFHGYIGRKIEGHESPVELPFETVTMPVTKNYIDAVLDSFGPDYMTPVKFDGDHEYPFYKKQEAAMTQLLKESGVDTSIDAFCRNWHKLNGED